ncbi:MULTISPECIES: hypothetical protein [Gammaproteobacteria]|uniref:hypothetical protein n=1 Tax=Gammaproteobacteria TaxID=1236 RepID=UPI00112E290F|nr:hypothetical protein [Pseudomonas sp. Hp2]
MDANRRVSRERVNGVFFASGPGFWETRPVFWLFVATSSLCLLFDSRALGWSGLSALMLGAWASRRGWRVREARRLGGD